MKETQDIISAYQTALDNGQLAALATVVKVEGSSYRQPGARMLVTQDGLLTGAISGGCLEGDALRKALLCISQRKNKLITYDTSSEEDAEFGVQLGCNGIVHLLFEFIDEQEHHNPIQLLKQWVNQRDEAVTVTLFSPDRSQSQPGTVLFYTEKYSGMVHKDFDFLLPDVQKVTQSKTSVVQQITMGERRFEGLFQYHAPALSLVIAGAGNDVMPLVSIAAMMGWDVTVVDGRASHAKPVRFPKARVLNLKAPEVLSEVFADSRTVFLLMTHNYQYDMALLKALLPTPVSYIGILGPKSKWERMRDELLTAGTLISEADQDRIFSPVGLDIGGETAAEIALSAIAEIQAFVNGKPGASLKFKPGKIHNQKQKFS